MINDFKLLRGGKPTIKLVGRIFDWDFTTSNRINIPQYRILQPLQTEVTFEMDNSEIIDRWMTLASRGVIVNR